MALALVIGRFVHWLVSPTFRCWPETVIISSSALPSALYIVKRDMCLNISEDRLSQNFGVACTGVISLLCYGRFRASAGDATRNLYDHPESIVAIRLKHTLIFPVYFYPAMLSMQA